MLKLALLKNKEELEQFLDSPQIYIVNMVEETAEFYAKIFGDLKISGKHVHTNNIRVAASALIHGLSRFTYDDHFKNIEGLILCKENY